MHLQRFCLDSIYESKQPKDFKINNRRFYEVQNNSFKSNE